MKKISALLALILLVTALVGCSKKSNTAEIVQPVESFYNAIVSQNRDRVSAIACADWEKDALREVDAFMGVKSELKDFSCSVSAESGSEATVTCKGSISASYGAEVTDFPLDGRSHRVIKEQGEWRICGY